MKKLVEKQTEQEEAQPYAEEERATLAALKGHGKRQKVGSVRVGEAKKSEGPGIYHDSAASDGNRSRLNTVKPKFGIFQVRNLL